jgi:RAB protein geranylgeranyltransferase component A
LEQLVSSKIYRQLEFQAVGNWWIYNASNTELGPKLKRLPNGREDIFEDKSIDNRAKRTLMKFLKFVVDYEAQPDIWQPHANSDLSGFLATQFQLPPHLQIVIVALTLSLDSPEETKVSWALPRIARHLTSIGVFGPGFGSIVPKWGGGAEIAQVACRAGAVGGGVYVLGTGIQEFRSRKGTYEVVLNNGEMVETKQLARDVNDGNTAATYSKAISRIVAVVSSTLSSLFESSVEGAPQAAVTVAVFPPTSLDGTANTHPVYIMAHSSETGECPAGQCQYCAFPSCPLECIT